MIYLIFTIEGFAEAKNDILDDKAELWINNELLSIEQTTELNAHGISINLLPDFVDPHKEKAILVALDYVESQSPKQEILVEYP